jgi:hypothetical protein
MPVIVTVDHERREVTAVCVGPVTLADTMIHLEREVREKGVSYRKLFDTRGSGFDISEQEAQQIADALRARSKEVKIGPAAMVVSSDKVFDLTLRVSELAADVCRIRPFRDEAEARAWLAAQPI